MVVDPFASLGLASQMLMTWPDFLGRLHSLSDVAREPCRTDVHLAASEIWTQWRAQENSGTPSLSRCLARVFGRLYFRYFALFLVVAVGQLAVAWSLSLLTQTLDTDDWRLATKLAGAYSLASFLTVCCLNQGFFRGQVLGSLARHSLTQVLLEKFSRLSKRTASSPHNKGLLLTLVSSELDVLDALSSTPFIFVTPVYVFLALPVMWLLLGFSGLAGVACVLLIYPVKMRMLKYVEGLRRSTLELKEMRTRAVQQLVEGVKTVKMYCWEDHLADEIARLKRQEHQQYSNTNVLHSISATFLVGGSALVLLVVLATLTALGEQLDAARIFGGLSVLIVMNNLVHGITNGGIDVVVFIRQALAKASELLSLPEHTESRSAGQLRCSHLSVDFPPNKSALRDVTFSLAAGELCIVAGAVGSGKSTLLAALAGEVPGAGQVSISISLAYVEQEPWIALSSFKENVTLGQDVDESRYWQVLQACALDADLQQMPEGDATFVGERGALLSGGQRARLSLARAAYHRREVYLLDDPLCALDAKVSQHVFHACILTLLEGTTRVLVTNNPTFFRYADKVLLLRDGEVVSFSPGSDLCLAAPPPSSAGEVAEAALPAAADSEEEGVDFGDYLRYLRLYFSRNWMLAALIALAVLVQVAQLTPYYWVVFWVRQDDQDEWRYLWVMAALVAALFLVAAARCCIVYSGFCKANERLHNQALLAVCHAPLSFFETRSSGDVIARFTKDMAVLEEQLVFSFADFLLIAAVLVSYFASLVAMSPILLPLLLFLCWLVQRVASALLPSARRLKRLELTAKAQLVEQSASFIEGVAATRALGLLGAQVDALRGFVTQSFQTQFCSATTLRVLQVRVDYLCIVFTSLNAFAAALFGGAVTSDLLAVGFSFTVVLIVYLGWFTDVCACLGNYMISAQRLMRFAALPPEEQRVPTGKLVVSAGCIVFRRVCLQYSQSLPLALKNVSFVVTGKTHVGIVGRTGAGKSSLLLALLRLKEICEGSILIDGQDIANASLRELRSKVTVIPQSALLFQGSLSKNADPTSQHPTAVVSQMLESLGLSGEQDATQLSAGQKQLLCLARALLRDTQIFLCDEATANIDQETEAVLQAKMKTLLSEKTVITVAHRLTTVLQCAQVMVMDAGKCVEAGSPETLRQDFSSRFAQLLRAAEETRSRS